MSITAINRKSTAWAEAGERLRVRYVESTTMFIKKGWLDSGP